METGINFLPEIAEKEIQEGVYRRKINIAAVGALLVILVVIVGLIAYQFFLTTRANDLKDRTAKAETKVSSYNDIEITNLALKEKLDKIDSFLKSSLSGSTAVGQLTLAAVPVALKSFTITDTGKVQVEGTAASSDTLEQWLNNLKSDSGKDYFANVVLSSLTGAPGNYEFSMSLDFIKKGVSR